jgi:predicted ATP-grasp superfamily ATP-dependent carboligase
VTSGARGLEWRLDPAAIGLRRPVLLIALEGWFDLGRAATTALTHLRERSVSTDELGRIDAEDYVDFSVHRPIASYKDGLLVTLVWPHTALTVVRTEGRHDLVLAIGVEPQLRWQSYADTVVEAARAIGAELVITVGGAPAEVPHTRPHPVTASAATAELARRLGLALPSYQGVTGVAGVLQDRLAKAGLPAISVRVGVPTYLGGESDPPGTRALLDRLGRLLGIETGAEDLLDTERRWREEVDEAVAAQPAGPAYVRELERRYDLTAVDPDAADQLVQELERYLDTRSEEGPAPEKGPAPEEGTPGDEPA